MTINVNNPQRFFCSQSLPVRALSTVYQNTTGRPRYVCASIRHTIATTGIAYCAAAADPSGTPVAYGGSQTAGTTTDVPLCFFVPPFYYYKVESAGGAIIEWTEWD